MLLTLALLTVTQPAEASTEDFGDNVIGTCDVQWFDDCEDEWVSFGEAEHLAIAYPADDITNFGVAIRGSSGTQLNGIARTLPIPSGHDEGHWTVNMFALEGSGVVVMTVRFLDSNGYEISSTYNAATVGSTQAQAYELYIESTIPQYATSMDIEVGALGSSVLMWVDHVEWSTSDNSVSSEPETKEYCEGRASAKKAAKKAECEAIGGALDGDCKGWPANQPGGCEFACFMSCKKALSTDPAITLPAGY